MAFFAVQPLVYLAAWIQLHVRGALYTLSNTIPINQQEHMQLSISKATTTKLTRIFKLS